MNRLLLAGASALLAVVAVAGPVGARSFRTVYVNDMAYRVFGNQANVPDGTGTDGEAAKRLALPAGRRSIIPASSTALEPQAGGALDVEVRRVGVCARRTTTPWALRRPVGVSALSRAASVSP